MLPPAKAGGLVGQYQEGEAMIELVHGLPGNVVGITTRGRVTRGEFEDVLLPAMDEALRRYEKVRLYYEIGSRYPGAGWETGDIGVHKLERIALVSDTAWVRQVVNAVRFLIATELRVFTTLEAEEGLALAWIAAPNEGAAEPPAPPPNRPPLQRRTHRRTSQHRKVGLSPAKSVRAPLGQPGAPAA